jgi:pyruvate dehydrogenase E2 component (dihydrolipoamide acetyltransferase)
MSARIVAVTMPKWGIEMTEGTIVAWLIEPGRAIDKGAPLLEVETEKIVNTVEAPASGTLRRIAAAKGDVRAVGSLIGVLAAPDVSDGEIDAFVGDFRGATVSFEPDADAVRATAASSAPVESDGEARLSPIARRLAERLGIDLSQVRGTGRNGRISKEDVEAHAARLAASGAGAMTRRPLSPTRLTIAKRLLHSSQSIPHYRLSIDVDAGALLAQRRALEARGVSASINDFIVRAAALALAQHPALNARVEGEEILELTDANIAVAVATEGGLLTPVVRRAQQKSVEEIARETARLTERARRGALSREELEGGTFTVSNLGMHGVDRFDAIINPPQVAILAVGAVQERAVARDGAVVAAPMATLTLSADHRVIDGAVAAGFLRTLRELIERPAEL